jgi:hypothetical protein
MFEGCNEVASATIHRSAGNLCSINMSYEPEFTDFKPLIKNLLTFFIKYANHEDILYLDVDVTDGVWASLGLRENRYANRPRHPQYGYEKSVNVGALIQAVS